MSRLVEVETHQFVGGAHIVDKTVSVISDKQKTVVEHYELTISGKDYSGRPVYVFYKMNNRLRHIARKQMWIDHLQGNKPHRTLGRAKAAVVKS